MAYLDKVRINNTDYQLVGTGEILPVGTELDIDKNATIPAGWQEIEYDTGWVNVPLDTTKCKEVSYTSGSNKDTKFTPQIRRIANIVYLRGRIEILKTDISSGSAIPLVTSAFDDKFLTNECEVNIKSVLNDSGETIYNVYVGAKTRTDTNKGKMCIYCETAGWSSVPTKIRVQLDTSWAVDELTTKRIKKVSETQVPSIGEIYDDQERVIGTWFGKPLYRKVIELTVQEYEALDINTENRKLYPLNFDIDNCVRGDTITTYQDSNNKPLTKVYPMHTISTNSYESGIHNIWDNNIVFYVGSSITSNLLNNIYLILEYTKTTD